MRREAKGCSWGEYQEAAATHGEEAAARSLLETMRTADAALAATAGQCAAAEAALKQLLHSKVRTPLQRPLTQGRRKGQPAFSPPPMTPPRDAIPVEYPPGAAVRQLH